MLRYRLILIFVVLNCAAWAQSPPELRIYSELQPYTRLLFGEPNDQGYQFIAGTRVLVTDSMILPGLLVQIDHEGELLWIDTLREFAYAFAHRIDSLLFLSSYHYYKYPDTLSTVILEICDLRGNVIKTLSHDFVDNFPFGAGVVPFNDSIYIFSQVCILTTTYPGVIFYEINIHTLDVQKRLAYKGAIIGNPVKIDDQPTYLEYSYSLWIKDTSFVHNNMVELDTTKASQLGTILPREDKPGWFAFGGCSTPSNFYGICMIALDENLKLDKVDLLYHPPTGNFYSGAPGQSICKSGNAYYATGMWNEVTCGPYFFNCTYPTEIVIAKYDIQLNRVWTKIVGGERRYWPSQIHPAMEGGFMVSGVLLDNLDNNQIAPFAMIFDADGDIVGVEEPVQPGRYEFTIYGNPGREALRIMARHGDMQVRLQVVDVQGRPILSASLTEGLNHFDTAWWPSGTYFIVITDAHGRALWRQPWMRE
jgi:hypothetical protein